MNYQPQYNYTLTSISSAILIITGPSFCVLVVMKIKINSQLYMLIQVEEYSLWEENYTSHAAFLKWSFRAFWNVNKIEVRYKRPIGSNYGIFGRFFISKP